MAIRYTNSISIQFQGEGANHWTEGTDNEHEDRARNMLLVPMYVAGIWCRMEGTSCDEGISNLFYRSQDIFQMGYRWQYIFCPIFYRP